MDIVIENNIGNITQFSNFLQKFEEFKEKIKDNSICGCLGHPDSLENYYINNNISISHIIRKIHLSSNILFSNITILDTEKGMVVKKLIDNEIRLLLKPRMIGFKPEHSKYIEIKDIITFDIITDNNLKPIVI